MINYLGNRELLKQHKVGFLAASKIAALSVLPTLDWASEIAKQDINAVVIGCHSHLEEQALSFLLKGKCGIIIAMHRGMYKTVPELYQQAFADNRLLFISLFKDSVYRPNRANALKRNKFITELSDEVVFSSLTPESSLYELYTNIKNIKPTTLL
jgi:predicted Rossmann fold nucleotide-binding protein DprA/Smf involved in DNA uptake